MKRGKYCQFQDPVYAWKQKQTNVLKKKNVDIEAKEKCLP